MLIAKGAQHSVYTSELLPFSVPERSASVQYDRFVVAPEQAVAGAFTQQFAHVVHMCLTDRTAGLHWVHFRHVSAIRSKAH